MEVRGKPMTFPFSGFRSSKDTSLFGIFDGMGGEECGEIAACIAAKHASTLNIGKTPVEALLQFCREANAKICSYARENKISSMGTTAAMLVFTKSGITLCNIGDSKIFRFCDGKLEQISKDHVTVSAYGRKPPLSQNLGIPPEEMVIDPYLAQGAYHENDIYLICSDGLTDMVTIEKIREILASQVPADAIVTLLNTALSNGGRDNISIILCKIERTYGRFFRWKYPGRK